MRVRAPLLPLVLALLAGRGGRSGADADGTAPTGSGGEGQVLVRRALGIAAVRVLAPAVLAPVVLTGALVGVLGVVLVLAGGITVAARAAGLG